MHHPYSSGLGLSLSPGGVLHATAFAVPSILRRLLAFAATLVILAGCTTQAVMETAAVQPLASEKYAAIVVDASSGRILYEQNARDPRYPASLTKMMTLYLLFEAIDAGRMTMATQLPVSSYAAGRPASKLYLKAGQTIDARSAVLALCVKSANDVATVVAEYLGGSEQRFADIMTSKARQLGMTDTTFRNASGLPDNGQMTTARDMVILASALRAKFPHHYHYFKNGEFAYAGKVIRGHNDLLNKPGVDGLKTGYIRASGFNVATSAARGGKRVFAVVMGGESASARNAHMEQLIDAYLPRAAGS
jgi:D-alanyl-D-alanine carboxypeptidase